MPEDQTKIVLTDGENIIVDLSVAAVSAELDQAVHGVGGSTFVRFRRATGTDIFIAADKVLYLEAE
jgi:hypothetical protein